MYTPEQLNRIISDNIEKENDALVQEIVDRFLHTTKHAVSAPISFRLFVTDDIPIKKVALEKAIELFKAYRLNLIYDPTIDRFYVTWKSWNED